MQDDAIVLHKAILKTIRQLREDKKIRYTNLCLEFDIPSSSFDNIMRAKRMSTFYNIVKIVKTLKLNFKEFGALLDKELPNNFMNHTD